MLHLSYRKSSQSPTASPPESSHTKAHTPLHWLTSLDNMQDHILMFLLVVSHCYTNRSHVPVVDLFEWPVPGRANSRRNFLDPLVSNKLFTFLNLAHRSLSFASRTLSSSSPFASPCEAEIDGASMLTFGPGVTGPGDPEAIFVDRIGLGEPIPSSCSCPILLDLPL